MAAVSPLAPARFPALSAIAGVRLAAVAGGIRYAGRDDLMLAELAPGTAVAGVFTRSLTAGAPVLWCRECLPGGQARAIVVNSGNANVFTGRAGKEAVATTAAAAAQAARMRSQAGLHRLDRRHRRDPADRKDPRCAARGGGPALGRGLGEGGAGDHDHRHLPQGLDRRRRDRRRRGAPQRVRQGLRHDRPGHGDDAGLCLHRRRIAGAVLQPLLAAAADRSFNAITVDGDTSTSDTLLLCATGQAAHRPVASPRDRRLDNFRRALDTVLIDLAQQVVRDGEGAQKFVTIEVKGAATARAARRIGLAIGNSPLVKTAISAGDANWGRIVMAVGKAGEKADRDLLSVSVGGIEIAAHGGPVPGYDEAPVAEHMKGREIAIAIDLGIGRGKATVWSCDLTHGYIDINGSYRS